MTDIQVQRIIPILKASGQIEQVTELEKRVNLHVLFYVPCVTVIYLHI